MGVPLLPAQHRGFRDALVFYHDGTVDASPAGMRTVLVMLAQAGILSLFNEFTECTAVDFAREVKVSLFFILVPACACCMFSDRLLCMPAFPQSSG